MRNKELEMGKPWLLESGAPLDLSRSLCEAAAAGEDSTADALRLQEEVIA